MTFLAFKSLFVIDNNVSHVHAVLYWEQSALLYYKLSFWQSHEVCEVRRQSAARLVEQCVDSTYQRVVAVIYVVLIRLPTVLRGGSVHAAYLHYFYVLLKGDIGRVSAVVEPVASYDAQCVVVFLDIVYYRSAVLYRSDVRSFEFLSVEQRVNTPAYGA